VYLEKVELGSLDSRGNLNIKFKYINGDILEIKEFNETVINVHSLCTGNIYIYT
jgi:hypothetical protein